MRWVPMVVFLGAYGLLVTLLSWTTTVLFTSLWPFLFLLLVPGVWWAHVFGRSNMGRVRGGVVVFLRLVFLGLLIAALTEPRIARADERLAVVFALDHSASIQPEATEAAIGYVLNAVSQKPEQDEAGLVFFGANANVELPPAMSLPYESINVEVDREGTDLAEALSLSAALLPPQRHGRIVLVSDGVATEGDLSTVLDDLASRQIAVDVVPVEYDSKQEVWLEKLELPKVVKLGETIEPAVVLSALEPGSAVLTLEEGGSVVARQRVQFEAGKSRFAIPLVIPEAGYYEYVARIQVPDGRDRWEQNNVAVASLLLRGRGSVLIVVDPSGNSGDHEHLAQALREQERVVQVMSGAALPREPLALLSHDCIVFVNGPRDLLDEVQMQAVHDAVFHQGSGFLMVGGQNSFGPGGYHHTKIEDLLPVSMDMSKKKVIPKGALAIVLHTCEFPRGNTWAKRITKQAIRVLNPRDDVGVLAFDYQGGNSWLFPLTPAGNYQSMVPKINNAQIGDMPGFAPTMQMALAGLQNSDASTRHVVIISDGDPSRPSRTLLAAYRKARISVSTVAVFPHGGATGGPDVATMKLIANATGGRFYLPKSPETLPQIFIKEAKTLRRSAIQNRTFTPEVQADSSILKGITALPQLHGYVWTTPKNRSVTILEGPDDEDLDPVLARWRYGIAATAAFTSDLGSNWGRDWVAWDHYRPLVHQLLTSISRQQREQRLEMRAIAEGDTGVVSVDDVGKEEELLTLQGVVQGPGGTQTLELEQVGRRRYEGRFPLSGVGRYRAMVSVEGAAENDRVHAGFALPYSQEYRRFRSNPAVLQHIADRTGGRLLSGRETGPDVFTRKGPAKITSRSILDWLLLVLVCLIPLEVAARRVQIDLADVGRWLRRERVEDQTMTALLRRKQEIQRPKAREPEPLPEPLPVPKEEVVATRRPKPKPEPEPREQKEQKKPTSTTGRLLAMKKRRGQKKKDDT